MSEKHAGGHDAVQAHDPRRSGASRPASQIQCEKPSGNASERAALRHAERSELSVARPKLGLQPPEAAGNVSACSIVRGMGPVESGESHDECDQVGERFGEKGREDFRRKTRCSPASVPAAPASTTAATANRKPRWKEIPRDEDESFAIAAIRPSVESVIVS